MIHQSFIAASALIIQFAAGTLSRCGKTPAQKSWTS